MPHYRECSQRPRGQIKDREPYHKIHIYHALADQELLQAIEKIGSVYPYIRPKKEIRHTVLELGSKVYDLLGVPRGGKITRGKMDVLAASILQCDEGEQEINIADPEKPFVLMGNRALKQLCIKCDFERQGRARHPLEEERENILHLLAEEREIGREQLASGLKPYRPHLTVATIDFKKLSREERQNIQEPNKLFRELGLLSLKYSPVALGRLEARVHHE